MKRMWFLFKKETDNVAAQMPGGGFGLFDACTREWNAAPEVWGQTYGGSATNTCSQFPSQLQPGCSFRWDWFQGADNPT